jgi:hypothetical protein
MSAPAFRNRYAARGMCLAEVTRAIRIPPARREMAPDSSSVSWASSTRVIRRGSTPRETRGLGQHRGVGRVPPLARPADDQPGSGKRSEDPDCLDDAGEAGGGEAACGRKAGVSVLPLPRTTPRTGTPRARTGRIRATRPLEWRGNAPRGDSGDGGSHNGLRKGREAQRPPIQAARPSLDPRAVRPRTRPATSSADAQRQRHQPEPMTFLSQNTVRVSSGA